MSKADLTGPAQAQPVQTSAAASPRLLSLDVYRGLTVAAMILVTDPGTYSATYAQLRHAEWAGATATDMIFPSFLFIVGVAIPFALASRGLTGTQQVLRILRRVVLLLVVGLLLNAFPTFDWAHLRLPGILQRIAICYVAAALLYLGLTPRPAAAADPQRSRRAAIIIASLIVLLLAGYWAVLAFAPVPGLGAGHLDSYANFPAFIDRALFGLDHLWAYGLTPGHGVTYDPEGLLSTLPAFTATLLGVLAALGLRSQAAPRTKVLGLLLCGLLLIALGCALAPWMPLNKRIYTPTFAMLSGGISLALFGVFYWLLDVRRIRRGWTPALIFGSNAILAFTLSTLITSSLSALHLSDADGTTPTAHTWLYEHLFTGWIAPINGSLAYACVIVLINLALLYPFYRRRLFLRL